MLVGTVLAVLGIDLALVFGLFAFLLNFIPSVGSLIATLLPLPIVLMSPDVSVLVAVLAIGVPGGIQFTIGNVLEPKIMGDALDLHPVAILMALILWGMLWAFPETIRAASIARSCSVIPSAMMLRRFSLPRRALHQSRESIHSDIAAASCREVEEVRW